MVAMILGIRTKNMLVNKYNEKHREIKEREFIELISDDEKIKQYNKKENEKLERDKMIEEKEEEFAKMVIDEKKIERMIKKEAKAK